MVDVDLQVSGLSSRPAAEWPDSVKEGVVALQKAFQNDAEFQRHAAFGVLQEKDLVRFLLARQCDVEAAQAMLQQALAWRSKRMPYWLLTDPSSDVAQAFRLEGRTGKVYVVDGCDRFGRGMCVLDNSVQNTVDIDAQLRYLAYCIEAARSNCHAGVDKVTVVVNLEAFSMKNSVDIRAVRETVEMLTVVHPETLGSCILWQVPTIFSTVFTLCKKLLDMRTLMKIIAINGDVSEGSPNSDILNDVVGENWRELTGLTTPRTERAYSEYFKKDILGARGFNFHSHWQAMLIRDSERAAAVGAPPWSIPWADAIGPWWDGAHRGFWEANLASPPDPEPASTRSDVGSEERWGTPPMSDAELGALPPPAPVGVATEKGGAAPTLLGKLVRVRSRQVGSPLDLLSYVSSSGGYPINGVWCLGQTSLAISCARVLMVFISMNRRGSRGHHPVLLRVTPRAPVSLWIFTLLDIPVVSFGIGLLSFVESLPRGAAQSGQSGYEGSFFLSCVPWGLITCSCLTLPEAVMESMRRNTWGEQDMGGNQFEAILAPLLLLLDAVLCILFAILWLYRFRKQVQSYAHLH